MLHVVSNGVVMPHLLDRNMETHLPVIPAEVEQVRFRWVSGERKYNYHFYRLESHDRHLLSDPTINIARRGRIPRGSKRPGGEEWGPVLCSVIYSVFLLFQPSLSGWPALAISQERRLSVSAWKSCPGNGNWPGLL